MLEHVHIYKFIMFGEEELICLTEKEHLQQNGNSCHEQSGSETIYLGKFVKENV